MQTQSAYIRAEAMALMGEINSLTPPPPICNHVHPVVRFRDLSGTTDITLPFPLFYNVDAVEALYLRSLVSDTSTLPTLSYNRDLQDVKCLPTQTPTYRMGPVTLASTTRRKQMSSHAEMSPSGTGHAASRAVLVWDSSLPTLALTQKVSAYLLFISFHSV